MQRAVSIMRALPVHMARRARAGHMDRLRNAAGAVAGSWPPACPLTTVNVDGNRPTGTTPSSSEIMGLLDEEDDETRFRSRKDGDRGPINSSAGKGMGAIREGAAAASDNMKAMKFRDDRKQHARQSQNAVADYEDDFSDNFSVSSDVHSLAENINDVVYSGPVMDALLLPSLDSLENSEPANSRALNFGIPVANDRIPSPSKTSMGVGATGTVGATLGRVVPLDENDAKKVC